VFWTAVFWFIFLLSLSLREVTGFPRSPDPCSSCESFTPVCCSSDWSVGCVCVSWSSSRFCCCCTWRRWRRSSRFFFYSSSWKKANVIIVIRRTRRKEIKPHLILVWSPILHLRLWNEELLPATIEGAHANSAKLKQQLRSVQVHWLNRQTNRQIRLYFNHRRQEEDSYLFDSTVVHTEMFSAWRNMQANNKKRESKSGIAVCISVLYL
jgi:hypothetical protein